MTIGRFYINKYHPSHCILVNSILSKDRYAIRIKATWWTLSGGGRKVSSNLEQEIVIPVKELSHWQESK